MSEQVTKEQTKGAEQENITELTDQQLAEAQGGRRHRNSIMRQDTRECGGMGGAVPRPD